MNSGDKCTRTVPKIYFLKERDKENRIERHKMNQRKIKKNKIKTVSSELRECVGIVPKINTRILFSFF